MGLPDTVHGPLESTVTTAPDNESLAVASSVISAACSAIFFSAVIEMVCDVLSSLMSTVPAKFVSSIVVVLNSLRLIRSGHRHPASPVAAPLPPSFAPVLPARALRSPAP